MTNPQSLIEVLRGVEACGEHVGTPESVVQHGPLHAIAYAYPCRQCALKIIAALGEKAAWIVADATSPGFHACNKADAIDDIRKAFGVTGKGE